MNEIVSRHYELYINNPEHLAVVIPTMNREKFIRRTVQFYQQYNIPIYIVDSSPCPIRDVVRANEFKLTTHYYHMPGLNEMQASWEAAYRCRARYIAWAGDDDFLLPAALTRAVQLLNIRPQVTSVAGHCSLLGIKDNQIYGHVESLFSCYPDMFFRVFCRRVIMSAWMNVKDLPRPERDIDHVYGCKVRSERLVEELSRLDNEPRTINELSLLRQVHPWRVTSVLDDPDSFRTKLGRALPTVKYMKDWMFSWGYANRYTLPALRRDKWSDYLEVERFLSK